MEERFSLIDLLQLFVLNQSISEKLLHIKISQIDFDTEMDILSVFQQVCLQMPELTVNFSS